MVKEKERVREGKKKYFTEGIGRLFILIFQPVNASGSGKMGNNV